jgi:type I restriction enzyme S subunit
MVPNDWLLSTLAEITKEKISYGIVQAGPNIDNGIPYIKSSNVRGGIDISTLQKTSNEIHYKYRRSAVHPGDIVFSLRGNIGICAIVPESLPEANLTQGTARISVNKENSNLYTFYQITSPPILKRINALSKGSTFKEISLEELRKVKIPVPSLFEQQKIATTLGTWDKAISTTERLIDNSKQQKKALMQQLLTGKKRLLDNSGKPFEGEWEEVHIADIAKVKKGKALSSKNLEVGDYPVIAGGKTSPYKHSQYTHEDVITISASGAYAGFVAYHKHRIWASDCSVIEPNKHAITQYIFQFLLLNQKKIYSFQSGGAQPHIYPKDIDVLKIKLPKLEEQQKITAVLVNADKEIELMEQQLADLKQEKKALMQQLLTGKRRVTIDEAEVA